MNIFLVNVADRPETDLPVYKRRKRIITKRRRAKCVCARIFTSRRRGKHTETILAGLDFFVPSASDVTRTKNKKKCINIITIRRNTRAEKSRA